MFKSGYENSIESKLPLLPEWGQFNPVVVDQLPHFISPAIISPSSADGDGTVEDGAGMSIYTIRQVGETPALTRPYVVGGHLTAK